MKKLLIIFVIILQSCSKQVDNQETVLFTAKVFEYQRNSVLYIEYSKPLPISTDIYVSWQDGQDIKYLYKMKEYSKFEYFITNIPYNSPKNLDIRILGGNYKFKRL